MIFKIGISPCPNDTFIFEALAEKHLQPPNLQFDFEYHDIAVLNKKAQALELDIVKVSYAHYFTMANEYILLRSGGAMGFGVGPLLLGKKENSIPNKKHSVAIPGESTTANFLLQYAFPDLQNKTEIPFDQIENRLIDNSYNFGVVIHESRFTYQQKGLYKIMDLGAYWETQERLPIPLGGIAIKRSLAREYGFILNNLVLQSIEWQQKQEHLSAYIQSHAQEMAPSVMQQHIDLYVNSFSKDLGPEGEKAVSYMQSLLAPNFNQPIFISC